jgi:hypothetical protein
MTQEYQTTFQHIKEAAEAGCASCLVIEEATKRLTDSSPEPEARVRLCGGDGLGYKAALQAIYYSGKERSHIYPSIRIELYSLPGELLDPMQHLILLHACTHPWYYIPCFRALSV